MLSATSLVRITHSPDPSLKVPANHASLAAHVYLHNQPQAGNLNPRAK
jgi:hypothetical protein